MRDVHDWFFSQAVKGSDPYRYNDDVLWITSTSLDEGMTAYARSDFYNGSWSTISIVVWPEYFNDLNLMADSMTVGGSPATLMWTSGGVIDQLINGDSMASAAAPPASDPSDPKDRVRRPPAAWPKCLRPPSRWKLPATSRPSWDRPALRRRRRPRRPRRPTPRLIRDRR